jgi:FlaA1/EpsC-like NDP-sugar epimerase
MIQLVSEQWRQLMLQSRNPKFWTTLFLDILLVLVAHLLAYHIRYDGQMRIPYEQVFLTLPFLFTIKISVFFLFGLYRGMWRYTSISDLVNIAKATLISSLLLVFTLVYLTHFRDFSRAVFLLDGILTFLFIAMHRGTIRYLLEHTCLLSPNNGAAPVRVKRRLLLIGAGSAAEKVIREINDNPAVVYQVVGMVDDNRDKLGLKIHNIPVLGGVDELGECIHRTAAEELLITIATASAEQMQRIIAACQESRLPYKVMPSLGEIITGDLSVTRIREVAYRDLLGRQMVHLDQQEICGYLTDRTILVTGAGGSIGSELCRQILPFRPGTIILLDSGEENLYRIEMELRHEHHLTNCVAVLGKIQNRDLLNKIFCQYAPSVVFHAAAYKHVPLVEANPWEAVFNNVFAVRNLIETAIFHQSERFVLVSTDKAVRPTSVMGASKRLTELLMLAYCNGLWDKSLDRSHRQGQLYGCRSAGRASPLSKGHHTTLMAVRFGNVLGSSGSVIPLFRRQIEQGGPVTVTHPEVTRFFMSVEEASQLILQAGAMGKGGEIFLLKMGQPVKIADLAVDLIKLMGLQPEIDIHIAYTGLRPGEKLYEELITAGEGIVPTSHEKIMVLRGDGKPYSELELHLSELADRAKTHDAVRIKEILHRLVPEYQPDLQATAVITTNQYEMEALRN